MNNKHSDGATLQSTIEVTEERLKTICSIHEETESNLDEEKLNNFLESSATVEIEVNRKINTLKTRVKMKIESLNASPLPTQRLRNDNRTKRYIKLPRLEIKKFSGDYNQWKSFMDSFEWMLSLFKGKP